MLYMTVMAGWSQNNSKHNNTRGQKYSFLILNLVIYIATIKG